MNRNSSYNLGRPEMATAAQRSVSPAVLDRLAQPQAASEPVDRNDAGESYVFRDFERSKITTMRLAIDRAPLRYSLICAAMTLFWTVIMSAGAGLNGSNGIVLNLTPNVALFAIALGVFLYPGRLLWVPLALFVVVFAYPFMNPFVAETMWISNPSLTAGFALIMFMLNLAAGLTVGLLLRGFFFVANQLSRPHYADLLTSIFGFVALVAVGIVQLKMTLMLDEGLSDAARAALGFTGDLQRLATIRIFRGGVVLTAFLIASIELPTAGQFKTGLIFALAYPVIALLQHFGFVLYPMVDVALFTVVLVIVLPVPTGLSAGIVGIALYSGLTGQFLNDSTPQTTAEAHLQTYSILLLSLIVFILAFRSRTRHVLAAKDGSMRRLNRVRDFAGVGLFSANLSAGRYRLDSAASRLLGRDRSGPLSDLLQCFDVAARDRLTTALARRAASGDTLTLPLTQGDGRQIMLEMLLWSETAVSGDDVTYGLLLDVTERNARKEKLQTALDELSSREERQRRLFSVISHEVRTPASVISMLIDELPDGGASATRRQLREATDQLLAVLGDMRQAVNPEKNLPVRRVPYVPSDLGESILSSLGRMAKDADVVLALDLDDSATIPREGDTVRSRQVLANLLRNALIHSHGTHVTLGFRGAVNDRGEPLSIWTVSDNGRGIPAEDEATIFDPFERGGGDSRKRADGSGLGLYIARSAVVVLGGSLTYQLQPSGGARFTVTLPEPELAELPAQAAQTTDAKAQPGLSILLAEDNTLVAEVMGARLTRDFRDVRLVTDGQALIDACRAKRPDVVLTDLFMPGLDGDEAVAVLRADGFRGPIVGLTAAAAGEEAERFIRAGADAVMFKPLDMADLHRLLQKHTAAAAPI